jgi:flagellar hook-associated protein 2
VPGSQSITGISSGLDTTAIVDAIIAFERNNAVRLEAEQAQKGNIITALKATQAKFLSLSSSISKLTRASTFEASTVNVSDETYITASAGGRVASGSYDLQVLALARNHQIASQGVADVDEALIGTGTILVGVGSGTAKVITINESNNSLIGVKDAINELRAGVTASIINDGTDENSYRLVISADKSGASNVIDLTSTLSGGVNLDFENGSFDVPESITTGSQSTSVVSLGASASYSGSENKKFTFTVAGSGTQTVGSDTITINWSDGTDSGSIEITDEDTEVALTGAGSDGLTLSFSLGDLTAGDVFRVDTFTPQLQTAADAQMSLGSADGGGAPLTVSSASNTFSDVIAGLTLSVNKVTEPGESVTITTRTDVSGIKDSVNEFITAYNGIMEYIDKQNTYDADTGESGVLFGDLTLWTMQNTMRGRATSVIKGIDSKYNQLAVLGIRHGGDGKLSIADYSAFQSALDDNLDDVVDLFGNAGQSSSQFIEFMSLTDKSEAGSNFDVDITAVAEKGRFDGIHLTDPGTTPIVIDSTNNHLRLKVDGLTSGQLTLGQGTYSSWAALVDELQDQIEADSVIGGRGITVSQENDGVGDYLSITGSSYGGYSNVDIDTSMELSAYTGLGLMGGISYDGIDVAGTINGEEAEGTGQILAGIEDNETTEGVKLKITMGASQLITGAEGDVTITRGIGTQLRDIITSATKAIDGTFDRRIKGYQSQIEQMGEQITDIDERLEIRRSSLLQKYWDMEAALGELNAQRDFLDNQISSLNSNWGLGRKR